MRQALRYKQNNKSRPLRHDGKSLCRPGCSSYVGGAVYLRERGLGDRVFYRLSARLCVLPESGNCSRETVSIARLRGFVIRRSSPGRSADRKAVLRNTGRKAVLRNTGRKAVLRNTGRKAVLRNAGRKAVLRNTGRKSRSCIIRVLTRPRRL